MSRTLTLAVVLAGLALIAEPAAAREKQLVNYFGIGTYQLTNDGDAAFAADAAGTPFDGTVVGILAASDGSLPEPGACEAATATVRLDGSRHRFASFDGEGQVCGQWTDTINRVTHVFTGRYTVTGSSSRRLVGTDGWYEVRLTDDGRASTTAVDT